MSKRTKDVPARGEFQEKVLEYAEALAAIHDETKLRLGEISGDDLFEHIIDGRLGKLLKRLAPLKYAPGSTRPLRLTEKQSDEINEDLGYVHRTLKRIWKLAHFPDPDRSGSDRKKDKRYAAKMLLRLEKLEAWWPK